MTNRNLAWNILDLQLVLAMMLNSKCEPFRMSGVGDMNVTKNSSLHSDLFSGTVTLSHFMMLNHKYEPYLVSEISMRPSSKTSRSL